MKDFTIAKTYFRGNPKYGRTTTLYLNGREVLSVMGVVGKTQLVNQYKKQFGTTLRQMMKDFDRAKAAGKIKGY